MTEQLHHPPEGQKVTEIKVYGEAYDEAHHRVDVDLIVRVADLSRWMLNVVTKDKYIQDGQYEAEVSANEATQEASEHPETGYWPVVVTEEDITDATLARLLAVQPITPELATHMVYLEPEPEE